MNVEILLRLMTQVAIVTGGGTGIGRGVALCLASNGWRVFICGRRESVLDEVCETAKTSVKRLRKGSERKWQA